MVPNMNNQDPVSGILDSESMILDTVSRILTQDPECWTLDPELRILTQDPES